MNNTLESRIARLEKLLAKSKSVKNEDFDEEHDEYMDLLDSMHSQLMDMTDNLQNIADAFNSGSLVRANDMLEAVMNIIEDVMNENY